MSTLDIVKRTIFRWYSRSKGQEITSPPHAFDNFISLWIAFNCWGYYETSEDTDRKMINSLKTNIKLKEEFEKSKKERYFLEKLLKMKGIGIPTHRPRPTEVRFDDENSFGDILEVIYTIRCNLFHGRKDPINQDDLNYVSWACFILDRIFSKLKDRSDFLQ